MEFWGPQYNKKANIKGPRDFEGKKVGVRAYTVTQGVWARRVLATEYGVDLDKVTWILGDEEPVEAFQRDAPRNAELGWNESGPVAKSSPKSQKLDQLDQN